MKQVAYNSQQQQHKTPFGAVSTEQSVRLCIHVSKTCGATGVRLVYRRDGTADSQTVSMAIAAETDPWQQYACTFTIPAPGLYFYRFEIETAGGTLFCGLQNGEAAVGDWLDEWQLTVYDAAFCTPPQAGGGIMYQIFPDRFCRSEKYTPRPAANPRTIHENWYDVPDFIYNTPDYKGNDYYCGNLQGIIEQLDYLQSLHVTMLYLNPVFESPENHRYSTANYMQIDPYLGTNEDFEELCRACAARGIDVLLDGVFSHTGADSIYFNKYGHYDSPGAYNTPDSPYREWYDFVQYPTEYRCWWNFENLPNVNECNPSYMDYITGENGVLQYWQKKGCKGWRLDVADELPDAFIDAVRARVKAENPNALLIGEVWEDATTKCAYGQRRRYLLGKQLDSVMNYPWRTAILDFVQNGDSALFHSRLMCIMENYPPPVLNCLMNSLSTHDTERAITLLGVVHPVAPEEQGAYVMTDEEYARGRDRLIKASFLQFTLPGIPCIYYGDEAGLGGFRDPYCRMGYPYGREDRELLHVFQTLGAMRSKFQKQFVQPFVLYAQKAGVYAYCRGSILCAVNLGETPYTLPLQRPGSAVWTYGGCTITPEALLLQPGAAAAVLTAA